jgi:hypothetical protein
LLITAFFNTAFRHPRFNFRPNRRPAFLTINRIVRIFSAAF